MSANDGESVKRVAGIRVTVPNRKTEIGRVHERVRAFAEENALSTKEVDDVHLALEELLTKIARYAHPDDDDYEVGIELELTGKELTLAITDEGVAYDPFSPRALGTSERVEELESDGPALHMIANLVDEASYERRAGRNVVTLVKFVSNEH